MADEVVEVRDLGHYFEAQVMGCSTDAAQAVEMRLRCDPAIHEGSLPEEFSQWHGLTGKTVRIRLEVVD